MVLEKKITYKKQLGTLELYLLITIVVTVIIGFVVTWFSTRQILINRQESYARVVKAAGASFEGEEIKQLSGNREDRLNDEYNQILSRTNRLRDGIEDAQYAYIFGALANKIFFYASATSIETKEDIVPGTIYAEADGNTWSPFKTGKAKTILGTVNHWGTFLTTITPIKDRLGNVVATFGADVLFKLWTRKILMDQAAITVFYLCLIIVGLIAWYKQKNLPKHPKTIHPFLKTAFWIILFAFAACLVTRYWLAQRQLVKDNRYDQLASVLLAGLDDSEILNCFDNKLNCAILKRKMEKMRSGSEVVVSSELYKNEIDQGDLIASAGASFNKGDLWNLYNGDGYIVDGNQRFVLLNKERQIRDKPVALRVKIIDNSHVGLWEIVGPFLPALIVFAAYLFLRYYNRRKYLKENYGRT